MSIGEPLPMRDAEARVRGTVPYASNLRLPNMLVAKVLRSTVPHARIKRLDTSAAADAPGVVAVLSAADFDGDGPPYLHFGSTIQDQPIVAGERIRYLGEPLALVAAESARAAKVALERIELEVEELSAVFGAEEALSPEAPLLHEESGNCFVHSKIRRGDVKAGLAAAEKVVEEVFTSPVAQQVALEPQVAIAQWKDENLTVWTASQSPFTVRRVLAETLGLESGAVRVIVPPLGGGFGGKGNVRTQPMVAALAMKTGGRPVKLILGRAEEFLTVTKHAAKIVIRSGVRGDGSLLAREVIAHWNGGAYASSSAHLVPAGALRSIGPYRIPAVHVDSYGVYTNLPPAAAYRGAMSSQGTFAYESHMDTIAHAIGMEPYEIRRKNLLRSGDQFATGETVHDTHYVECLEAALEGLSEQDRTSGRGATEKIGRGMAVMNKHTIANSISECKLVLSATGELELYTSTVEMGQGAHTALSQIAAEALGLPVSRIHVRGPDTDRTPPDAQTAASRSTYMMGNAILRAAAALEEKIAERAVLILEEDVENLTVEGLEVFVDGKGDRSVASSELLQRNDLQSLEAMGKFETNVGSLDPETGQGVSTPHWHQGAGACEVAVDIETGKVTVLRYHSASFAGRVVNPLLAGLQNDGNVIFGLGATLFEEVNVDGGQITNPNLADYMIPSFEDMPRELKNVLLEAEGSDFHGIGEMTLPPVAPAVANAIYDAVGVRIRDLPITAEKVLRALGEQ